LTWLSPFAINHEYIIALEIKPVNKKIKIMQLFFAPCGGDFFIAKKILAINED
jgi:hypothetical protein